MSVLRAGKAVLRGIYALHKAAAVKPNRVAVISRQSNAPSVDIQMLTEALRADGDLDDLTVSDQSFGESQCIWQSVCTM